MENSDYITMALAVAALICFILVIIQLFLVRAEINKNALDVYQKADEARDSIVQAIDNSATLQVYPLVIDTVTTRDLNPSLKYFATVLPMLVPRQFNVPYICNDTIKSLQTDVYQVGLLVTHQNNGSQRLAQDVAAGRIQYLYLQRKPFLILAIEEDVITRLQQFSDTHAFKNMDQRTVFALYAIESPENIVTTPTSSCTIAVTSPFTQGTVAAFKGRNGIDLIDELNLLRDQETLHALGYKL